MQLILLSCFLPHLFHMVCFCLVFIKYSISSNSPWSGRTISQIEALIRSFTKIVSSLLIYDQSRRTIKLEWDQLPWSFWYSFFAKIAVIFLNGLVSLFRTYSRTNKNTSSQIRSSNPTDDSFIASSIILYSSTSNSSNPGQCFFHSPPYVYLFIGAVPKWSRWLQA